MTTAAQAGDIHNGMLVEDLLRQFPAARAIVEKYWLRGSGGPIPTGVTLAFFAGSHRVQPEVLLAELRAALAGGRRAAA